MYRGYIMCFTQKTSIPTLQMKSYNEIYNDLLHSDLLYSVSWKSYSDKPYLKMYKWLYICNQKYDPQEKYPHLHVLSILQLYQYIDHSHYSSKELLLAIYIIYKQLFSKDIKWKNQKYISKIINSYSKPMLIRHCMIHIYEYYSIASIPCIYVLLSKCNLYHTTACFQACNKWISTLLSESIFEYHPLIISNLILSTWLKNLQ